MTDLSEMFTAPNDDALSILLGHDVDEASAWTHGADLAGVSPATVQALLAARRSVRGHAVRDDETEIGVAAVSAFLLPVASSLREIDDLHDRLAAWLAPMFDGARRSRLLVRADEALVQLAGMTIDDDERHECLEALQATALDVGFEAASCSVNVIQDAVGRHHLSISACINEDEDHCVEIGRMPFVSDEGDGPNHRSRTPVAPVPQTA